MEDPLEGILQLDPAAQVAVIVSVLRSTRNTQARLERKLDWINRAMWSLAAAITVAAASILFRPGASSAGMSAIHTVRGWIA